MSNKNKAQGYSFVLNIIIWGAVWGVFEATVGYLLHSISFGYSWILWYPAACFFMTNVYRKTGRISSIFLVGLFSASVKLLNLFLPGRIDKVINPAISIVFESLAMAAVVFAVNRLFKERRRNPLIKLLSAFTMNTGWRILFIVYLLFFVPNWIRDISVISSTEKLIPFFITQNLITSILIFTGYQFKSYILKPLEILEHRFSNWRNIIPNRLVPIFQIGFAAVMLCINIILQLILK